MYKRQVFYSAIQEVIVRSIFANQSIFVITANSTPPLPAFSSGIYNIVMNDTCLSLIHILTRRGAESSADETKAGCIPWTFAPVVDLGRDPRWARMWENYGEDCYVNAEMGVSAVKGFQGEDPNRIGAYNVACILYTSHISIAHHTEILIL